MTEIPPTPAAYYGRGSLQTGEQMTDEQRQSYVRALLEERQAANAHRKLERVKQIDAELRRVGYEAKAPAKRAERRTSDA